MGIPDALATHLATGVTTLCRCWLLRRSDGMTYGFTDHDCDLSFDGQTFKADTGLSAAALQQATGLSVDNGEAMGALTDTSLTDADIEAGRLDAAELFCWLVNWGDVSQKMLQFRGSLGEVQRSGGAFTAELRGLTDQLNQPDGRAYQKPCSAVLGDFSCGFDLTTAGYATTVAIAALEEARIFRIAPLPGFETGWFQRGQLRVQDGPGTGLSGVIKRDYDDDGQRVIELWAPLRAEIAIGDQINLVAGCDKRFDTCRFKFNNLLNFQGFPDIPGDDWTVAYPAGQNDLSGGSRR